MTFTTENNTVWMNTSSGSVRLSEAGVESLLNTFEEEGVRDLFLDLYEAAAKTDWFIPRTTSMRRAA